eukprot:4703814-Pyramimonas_sp.AAC.1
MPMELLTPTLLNVSRSARRSQARSRRRRKREDLAMPPLAAESPPNASASTVKTVGGDGHAEEPPQPEGN